MSNLTHKKRIESEKNGDKNGKPLYKSMNNAVCDKIMEGLRNRVDIKLVNYKKDHLKWTSKPGYMSQKVFDNLVTVREIKVTLTLDKSIDV